MKPERGSTEVDDMEEMDKDPRDLLQELVLEVLEARTPDPSSKGRIEGPHCPQSRSAESHICNDDRLECQRVYSLEKHLDLLWRNNIPACMDVLLYPNCVHGRREAQFLEVCSQAGVEQWTDNCLLLERWTFKFCQKRVHTDKSASWGVGPTMLLQAIKSYLHFSQLSSWLLSSGGCLPLIVVHRLYAPGENVGYDFEENPDQHRFPTVHLTHYGVKVSVSALPRREVVYLQCKMLEQEMYCGASPYGMKMAAAGSSREEERQETEEKQTERGRSLKRTRHHQSEMSRKRENRRYQQGHPNDHQKPSCSYSINKSVISDSLSSTSASCDSRRTSGQGDHTHRFHDYRDPCKNTKTPMSVKSVYNRRNDNKTPTDKDFGYTIDSNYSGIQPEQSDFRESYPQKFRMESPSRLIFKDKPLPLYPDSHLQVDTMSASSKCLHSPKVLMTSNTKPDQVFKKKCLDLSTSSDSDEWDNQYMSMKIKDLASPLSPSDIQSYLASLQTVACTNRSQANVSELCSTPKGMFYLGNEFDASVDNGYQSGEKGKFPAFKTFTPSLSQSDLSNIEVDPNRQILQDDLDSVTKKLQGLSPFNHSESPPTKREKRDISLSSSSKLREDSVQISQNLDSSLDLPSKTCKRKYYEESPTVDKAKCSSLEDSGLVTGDGPSANGHTPCVDNSVQNGVTSSHDAPAKSGSSEDEAGVAVSESEQSLCNNCDKPINVRLSYLRKVPTTPTLEATTTFHHHMTKSASMMFSSRTGLPTQSSPAPIKRKSLGRFDYDSTLTSTRAIKNALSCSKLVLGCMTDSKDEDEDEDNTGRVLSTSAPASTNCLLGNFEESVLNGRIEPIGAVDGFTAEIGASGSFCPKHVILPVTAYFFKLSDDNAPSPYLGHINLEGLGKRGYHIPKRGTVQVTLFNPNKTVVKMFVVMYDLSDIPANCQTFLRQRTLYMPGDPNSEEPAYLRYLIHLRFASSKSGKVHLHTDIRLIFARDKFEFDPKVAQYELRSFNEGPKNPKFSPKR